MSKPKSPRKVADNEALSVGTQIRGSAQKLGLVADPARSDRLRHQRLPFLSAAWPGKKRVGANSPSFMPTMSSLTDTGTNLRPL